MASSELLKQIQAGKRLKKAETNDRSAPAVEPSKGSRTGGAGVTPSASVGSGTSSGVGGPPQLAGLLAGGLPKLRPTGQSSGAKPSNLAKPPTIPRRDNVAPTPPAPPATHSLHPAASIPPSRATPALPARTPSNPIAPAPPRRAPPPVVSSTPPSRPSPLIPERSSSPARPSPSSIQRPVPAPPRPTSQQPPSRLPPSTPGRAPPPPPPRPTSSAPSLPARAVPPPPARKAPVGAAPAPPSRAPPTSEAATRSIMAAPPIVPVHSRVVSDNVAMQPPIRIAGSTPSNGITTRPPPPRRKIPSPPPNAGQHIFPVTDFPPPREFQATTKQYASGRTHGSDFDLESL